MKKPFFVDEHATRTPDHLAIISPSCELTYREVAKITYAIQQHLSTYRSVKRVAILLPINLENVLIFIALLRLDALIIPLNIYFSNDQILSMLDECKCDLLICEQERSESFSDYPILFADTINNLATEKNLVVQEIDIEKPCTVVFTSGSSGKAKGVVHSIANHYYSALGSNVHIPLDHRGRWLLSLPLYHVAGIAIVFRCLLAGATIVIGENNISHTIHKHDVSHVSMVTTQLRRVLQEEIELPSLQHVLLGGSAIPGSLVLDAVNKGLKIYTSYGSTEMASQIATTQKITSIEHAYTAKPLLHRDVTVSTDGEILVRGKTLCLGYLQQQEIMDIVDENGWFHTGDYGSLDDGSLQVYGRRDHMFISGGENIHPQEIEQQLCSLPGVLQAIIVAVPDVEYGFRPVAFVDTDCSWDDAMYSEHLSKRVARFKVPNYFFPWPDDVPTRGIKPDRKYLQELAEKQCKEE